MYDVQNIVTAGIKDMVVARLRFYADKDLEMTVVLKDMFQHAFANGEFEMGEIIVTSKAKDGQGFDVMLDWIGSDEGQSLREQLANVWDGAPQFVKSELLKLRLDQAVRSHLQTFYGITL